MKKEDIYNAITDIREDLIIQAVERRKRSFPWKGALAACLALVLVTVGALVAIGRGGKAGDKMGEAPGASPGDYLTGQPSDGTPDGETTLPHGGSTADPGAQGGAGTPAGDGELSRALALVEAVYPKAVPYPADGDDTGAWSAYQREHTLDPTVPKALRNYLDAAVPALLTGTSAGNSVCSPVNLFAALAMLAETAEGETRAQLMELLGVDSIDTLRSLTHQLIADLYNDDGAEVVRLASSLWLRENVDYDLNTLNTLAESYYASAYAGTPGTSEMDAALRDWLNAQTEGLLKDSVGGVSLDPDTAAAIAATVYFSAKWSRAFLESNNDARVFHAPSGDRTFTFMNGVFRQDYYPGDGFIGVELRFKLGGSMRFLLPEEGVRPEELFSKKDALDFLISPSLLGRRGREAEIHLSVPKFDVMSDTDLADTLRSLGVTDVFEPERADLSGLLTGTGGSVWVSRVLHSARVKMDESGCEAAAFTFLEFPTSEPPTRLEVLELVLDRPFLFSVTEEGVPLFVGAVNEP